MDDARIGRVLRGLRRRRGWSQAYLAERSEVSQDLISLIESGRGGTCTLRRLRTVFNALDARVELEAQWRGGDLDRLLDEAHAQLVGASVSVLRDSGWAAEIEVTYSHYGERGSLDILGWHANTRSLLAVEVKSELASVEATLRKLDAKARLAAIIAAERYTWRARLTSRLLILPATRTQRRRVDRHRTVFDATHPVRGLAVRSWLRHPDGQMAGLLFLTDTRRVRGERGSGTSQHAHAGQATVR